MEGFGGRTRLSQKFAFLLILLYAFDCYGKKGDMSLKDAWEKNRHIQKALLDKEERWMSMFKKGHGSLSEIMKADFGTENPVGLDVDHWADDVPISFQDARDSAFYNDNKMYHWKFLGSVRWTTPEKVDLHPVFSVLKKLPSFPFQKEATDMFSHETLHSRQGFERKLGFYSLYNISVLKGAEPKDDEGSKKIKGLQTSVSIKSFNKYSIKDYLAEDVEVQARFHEIITNAYSEWGRVPNTPTEFFAGMHQAGMKMPPSIMNELSGTQEGRAALETFKLGTIAKESVKRPVDLLNAVHEYAKACGAEEALWKEKYLYIFGHQLELYGDKMGRERMDMGENPRATLQVLKALLETKAPLTAQESLNYASQIPAEHSPYFMVIIRDDPQYKNKGFAHPMGEALYSMDKISQDFLVPEEAPQLS